MRIPILGMSVLILGTGCSLVRPVVAPPVIDCGPAQHRYCEAPLFVAPNYLGETEPEDADNRGRWLVCATDHRVVVDCLKALGAAGVIKESK